MTKNEFYDKWHKWWFDRSGYHGDFCPTVALGQYDFMNVVKKIYEDAQQIEEDEL